MSPVRTTRCCGFTPWPNLSCFCHKIPSPSFCDNVPPFTFCENFPLTRSPRHSARAILSSLCYNAIDSLICAYKSPALKNFSLRNTFAFLRSVFLYIYENLYKKISGESLSSKTFQNLAWQGTGLKNSEKFWSENLGEG